MSGNLRRISVVRSVLSWNVSIERCNAVKEAIRTCILVTIKKPGDPSRDNSSLQRSRSVRPVLQVYHESPPFATLAAMKGDREKRCYQIFAMIVDACGM
jgi:hypothetical protein